MQYVQLSLVLVSILGIGKILAGQKPAIKAFLANYILNFAPLFGTGWLSKFKIKLVRNTFKCAGISKLVVD